MPAPLRTPLLLDLDKTLVNVEDAIDYCAALEDLRRLVPEANELLAAETSWNRCTRAVIALLGALAGTRHWDAADRAVGARELAGAEHGVPMPGLADLVAVLDPERTAIVTLLGHDAAARTLERHVPRPPRVVVARRPDLRPKPQPDQALEALRELGCAAADAVMVGDSEVDEATARAAGVAFVGVSNGRDGHRFSPGTPVARDLHDVRELLVSRSG